jgi:hypothetical protein
MADTINLPGLGPTKATYVYAGGALVIGIVGYAWYQNQKATANADFVGAQPEDYATGEYDSPLGNSGGNSTGDYDSTDPNAIRTNAQWTAFAVEKLSTYNYDAATVASALGKYLARQGLTETEIGIVQQAIAVAGPPPIGGPYPISNALPNNPTYKPYIVYYLEKSNPPRWALAGGAEKWQEISGADKQDAANQWVTAHMGGTEAHHLSQAEWAVQKAKYLSGN